MPGSLHDVVHGLTIAIGNAECLKMEDPALVEAADKFVASVAEARKEVVEKALERRATLRKSRSEFT